MRSLRPALLLMLAAAPAAAQCNLTWNASTPLASTTLQVQDLTVWDPDGPGPAEPRPVLAWRTIGGASGVLEWNDQSGWQPLGADFDILLLTILATRSGGLYAAGVFGDVGGVAANSIARWDGAAWVPLGTGLTNGTGLSYVYTLAELPDGRVFAGGNFNTAGGAPVSRFAVWDGSAWSHLGTGVGADNDVRASAVLANGDLIAGGLFSSIDNVSSTYIARWDGQQWSALGAGLPNGQSCRDIEATFDGTGIVAMTTNNVHTWDGAWTATTQPPVAGYLTDVTTLPGGDVMLAAGGGAVLRWDGAQWHDQSFPHFGSIQELEWSEELGAVLVLGRFRDAALMPLPGIQPLVTSCPANASVAAGCGAGDLRVDVGPWLGATMRTRATELPPASIALVVRGLAPTNVPLTTILPQGTPGCALLAAPDAVDLLLVPNSGEASATLAVPTTTALLWLDVFEHWLSLTIDPTLGITGLSATDALTLTVGTY